MMQALAAILERPRSAITFMVVVILAGVWSYITLPKEANPDIPVPVFYTSITLQGISPEDADRLLIKPMETELRGLEGLKEIISVASQGHAGIILEFDTNVDQDAAELDVREKVDLAKSELPTDAEEPTVSEINLSLFPVIAVALYGDAPEETLFRNARALREEIESIPSVLEANLAGQREELLEVVINEFKLASYNISQTEVLRVVQNNNRLVAAGSIDTGKGKFNVKVPGLFETAKDIYDLPIKVDGDRVVKLSDVADIKRTFKDRSTFARFNGKPAIVIQVVKRIGTNIIETNSEVRSRVENFTKDWPGDIKIGFTLDQSNRIFEVLSSLQNAILTAIALVMIVVVAALGMRSALLVGISIPASFMIGFLLVSVFGLTINTMVLFGLVLTVGILVDGAIVVVEYADRKMAEGIHRRQAYVQAAQRMFWPIISSTATTLAAFLPMLLWPGTPGKFMSYLPITVIIVLTASLVTAMIFLPVLGRLFGKSEDDDNEALKELAADGKGDILELPGFVGRYVRFLNRAIRHPLKICAGLLVLFGVVIGLFTQFNNGVIFFVDTEPEEVIVFVTGRGNLSSTEEMLLVSQVENRILKIDGIKSVFSKTGSSGGGPTIGGGAGSDIPKDMIGQLTIDLKPYRERRPGKAILQEMRDKTKDLPGIFVEVRKAEKGPPTGKDVRLQIKSSSQKTGLAATKRVREYFESMDDLRDLEDDRPLPGIEWVLNVDREEAGRYGADIAAVGGMIQMVTNGILIGKYRPDNSIDEIDIRARFPKSERGISQLDELRLQTSRGLVPISNFVERKAVDRVDTIVRRDGRITYNVKANVNDGVLANDKVQEIDRWLKAQTWPPGVEFRFRGADEEQKESGAFLMKAMLAALFIMFIILLTQFNSFYYTALTLATVVISAIGVLIGMMVTGQAFSVIMTGTGVLALAGIVVNNSIVLIDTFQRLQRSGYDVISAVLRTAAQRIRPVMLTTITTICGLLPMALQINFDFFAREITTGGVTSSWWVSLSTAIISGLLFATLLTLVLTPIMIAAPTIWRQSRMKKKNITAHEEDVQPRNNLPKAAE